jgi:hypothetical protein
MTSTLFNFVNPVKTKKTALKLINKYADSYNLIIKENAFLKDEIKDLHENIRINKEIIESFFSKHNTFNDRNIFIIKKLKEESSKLLLKNEGLHSQLQSLHSRLSLQESTYLELLTREKEESEKLKTKLFLCEQSIKKKDNLICMQRKKIMSQGETFTNYPNNNNNCFMNGFSTYFTKEILVIEPNSVIIEINNELLKYKELCERLQEHIKHIEHNIKKYEQNITTLQEENVKLRTQFKKHVIASNKERENLIRKINKVKYKSSSVDNCFKYVHTEYETNVNNNNNNDNNTKLNNINGKHYKSLLKKLQLQEDEDTNKKFENEEFVEVIKLAGLGMNEYNKLSKMNLCSKLTDVIEIMFRLLKDKNRTLDLLDKENDNLIAKNYNLNRTNMNLNQEVSDLKTEIRTNSSFISRNTNSNIPSAVKNTIDNYKKVLKAKKTEKENDKKEFLMFRQDNNTNTKEGGKGEWNNAKHTVMNVESITSSEFREDIGKIESFLSTIRLNNSDGEVKLKTHRLDTDDNGMKCKNDDHYSDGGDYDNSMVNNHNKKLLNHSGLMDIDVDDIRMNYV